MKPCEYCGEKEAVTKCSVCGSMICNKCKKEHGCKACGGGIQTFS